MEVIMARRKNYLKQLETLQKKLTDLEEKYNAAKETIETLEAEREEIVQEMEEIKLLQLRQLMDEKQLTVDDLKKMIENAE